MQMFSFDEIQIKYSVSERDQQVIAVILGMGSLDATTVSCEQAAKRPVVVFPGHFHQWSDSESGGASVAFSLQMQRH